MNESVSFHNLEATEASLKDFFLQIRGVVSKTQGDAHKNQRGRAFLLGGALASGGAISLSAKACLHAGLGYATILDSCVGRLNLETIGEWCVVERTLKAWELSLERDQVLIFGPGLAADAFKDLELCEELYPYIRELSLASARLQGIVLDGGGLALFLRMAKSQNLRFDCPVALTPHPLEAGRMLEVLSPEAALPSCRHSLMSSLMEKLSDFFPEASVLLKGGHPLFADVSSEKCFELNFESPALATAGSGDVLCGFVAGMLFRLRESTRPALAAIALSVFVQALSHRDIYEGMLASELSVSFSKTLSELVETL
ncbi:hypothetical protein GW915_04270 [bacterium]|nr:hypothetical protein [bacterium]